MSAREASRGPIRISSALLVAGLASAITACDGTGSPIGDRSATPLPSPTGSLPDPSGSPFTATPAATADDGLTRVDPMLIGLLPATVAGVPLEPAPEVAAEATADRAMAEWVERFAAGAVFVGPDRFAVASVAALRPGVVEDDGFWDRWRDDYDHAACEASGGLAESETIEVAGRSVETSTCAGGAATFHVRLSDREVLVSILEIGGSGLALELIRGLTA